MNRNPDGIAAAEVRGLIREAQAGSQVACSALRRQYDPLVQTMLNGFYSSCRTAQERKDLAEEAEYAFLGALSSYDVGQTEVTFGLYARVCLRNGLVSAVRHIEALRRLHVVRSRNSWCRTGKTSPQAWRRRNGSPRCAALCRGACRSMKIVSGGRMSRGHRCRRSRRHLARTKSLSTMRCTGYVANCVAAWRRGRRNDALFRLTAGRSPGLYVLMV